MVQSSNMFPSLLFQYKRGINNGIHIYQFTSDLLALLSPDVVVVSDLNKNIGGSTDLAKKARIGEICIPLFTPLNEVNLNFHMAFGLIQ